MGTAVGFLNPPVRTKFSLTMEPPQKWVRPRAATDRSETWLFSWKKLFSVIDLWLLVSCSLGAFES